MSHRKMTLERMMEIMSGVIVDEVCPDCGSVVKPECRIILAYIGGPILDSVSFRCPCGFVAEMSPNLYDAVSEFLQNDQKAGLEAIGGRIGG